MKKFWFQLFGLVLLTSIAMFLAFNQSYLAPFASMFKRAPTLSGQIVQKTNKLVILGSDGTQKAQINIELANTKEIRSKGLGYRDSLATTSGMLFIHETPQKYTYWMKGMKFPIDIMWISGDTIADIIPNVPPPIEGQTDDTLERYQSTVEVDKVLETNAGFVMQNNILEGDKIVVTTR
jgi:uncharacterized membrane protein (UPF0127 family)